MPGSKSLLRVGVAGGRSDRCRFEGAEAWVALGATLVALSSKHVHAITWISRDANFAEWPTGEVRGLLG